jgi:hypothetical protein
VSASGSDPVVEMVRVTSAPPEAGAAGAGRAASAAPQLAQKELPGGFSVPQEVQNTRVALRVGSGRTDVSSASRRGNAVRSRCWIEG